MTETWISSAHRTDFGLTVGVAFCEPKDNACLRRAGDGDLDSAERRGGDSDRDGEYVLDALEGGVDGAIVRRDEEVV